MLFNPFQTKRAGFAHTHLQQSIKLSQLVLPAMQRNICTQTPWQAEMGGWQLLAEEGDRPLGEVPFSIACRESALPFMQSKLKSSPMRLLEVIL